MLKALKQLLVKTRPSSDAGAVEHKHQEADDAQFHELRNKLNSYFADHPMERQLYIDELNFLNSDFKTLPGIDKLFYAILPYQFLLDFDYRKISVQKEIYSGLNFVQLDNKNLFYHKGFANQDDVRKSFTFLSAEQHKNSPHRYVDKNFELNEDDVVADLGAAEGNFSLMIVERVKKLVIVEADPVWIEALQKTFEPWKEKVVIINKFLGPANDENTVSLDALGKEFNLTACKMDIEGAEIASLNYSRDYLRNAGLKMAITTYHRQTDADDIAEILQSLNYETTFTSGYMVFVNDNQTPPYFRKGMIKTIVKDINP